MEQSELMRLIIQALETVGIPYMITGSQASAYYGEPRFTSLWAQRLGLAEIWEAVNKRLSEK